VIAASSAVLGLRALGAPRAMSSSSKIVKTLFVTLHRSLAGKSAQQNRVVAALGLTRRDQCVEQPNSPQIRGMLAKVTIACCGVGCISLLTPLWVQVAHLVRVETDDMYRNRLLAQHEKLRTREPVVIKHTRAE
jgi:ribosomal protein L30